MELKNVVLNIVTSDVSTLTHLQEGLEDLPVMLTAEIDPNGNSSLAKGVVRVMYGNGNVHDRVRGPVILLQIVPSNREKK
jgi:hypothetical protein